MEAIINLRRVLLERERRKSFEKASAVFHLNDWDLRTSNTPEDSPLLAGVYLPDEESCRELEGMADCGFGMSLLAVLRINVDHMGRIFSHPLRRVNGPFP